MLAGVGIVQWRKRRWSGHTALALAMLASILLRCALLLTLDNSDPRYTLEFFPVLFFFGAVVLAKASDWSRLSSRSA